MLSRKVVRSSVRKSLRLFGEPSTSNAIGNANASANVDVISNVEDLKSVKHLDRTIRSQARECLLAASKLENPSKSWLNKLETIVRKTKDREKNELTSRTAALVAANAYKLGCYNTAEKLVKQSELCPSIIRRSLLIAILAKKGEFDRALDEMEASLCEDDTLFNSLNTSISEEALDLLHAAIKDKEDTLKQMQRFRTLQRVITQHRRRSQLSIDACLHAPIEVPLAPNKLEQMTPVDWQLSDQVIEDFPHFMTEKPKKEVI